MRLNSSNRKSMQSSTSVNFAGAITGGSPWADGTAYSSAVISEFMVSASGQQ